MGFQHTELGQKLLELSPIIVPALAKLVDELPKILDDMEMEQRDAWWIAMHTIIIEIPTQFCIAAQHRFSNICRIILH